LTNEIFVERCQEKYEKKYDYSKVKYVIGTTKVEIICPVHGSFWQLPSNHLRKTSYGCPECYNNNQRKTRTNYIYKSSRFYTTQTFIEKARIIHDDYYDYSKVKYVNGDIKVEIICPVHGSFWQSPAVHLMGNKSSNAKDGLSKRGCGCAQCRGTKIGKRQTHTTKIFIEKAKNIHGEEYDYRDVQYTRTNKKVKIFCKHCETYFLQIPTGHLRGYGCPNCIESKGERKIREFLVCKNLEFIEQYGFDKQLKYKLPLRFDFFIPSKNICVEFDGRQHFEPVKYFGGTKSFIEQMKRDEIKNEFCVQNNIDLIRIPHFEFKNINRILEEQICSTK